MNYTLSYSEGVAGWVSFYSYYPDWMIGMNNYFYTFKGGNLYRHNVNNFRNTFYQTWWTQSMQPANAFTPTSIQTVFNTAALENKLFKTINIEGDAPWGAALETDLQFSGFINQTWFEKKEASYFAFVRNNSIGQLALRSLNGIGNSLTVTGAGTNAAQVNFSINPLISIGNIISIGDYIYFGTNTQFAGTVVDVIVDYPAGINRLIVNNNMVSPLTTTIPGNVNYFFYIKNSVAESHGVLGHYCTTTLSNDYNSKIELFAVEANVMKSFP
jgi:fumarate reductase subunit C